MFYALPDDLSAAYWTTAQCLKTAGWLLDHARHTNTELAMSDAPERGARFMQDLAKWIEVAKERFSPLELYLCDAFDEPPKTSYGNSSCYFRAAIEVSERILDAIWTAVDAEGYAENTIRLAVITSNWKEGIMTAVSAFEELERPDERLQVMIFKEAIRAALKRDGEFKVIEETPAESAKVRKCYERDKLWTEWYNSAESGCAGSPTKIGQKWNGMTDSERKEICSTAWKRIPKSSLRDTVRKAIVRFLGQQRPER
jgi:hypothetical protein